MLFRICYTIFLLHCTNSSPSEKLKKADYRLPTTIVPDTYTLMFTLPTDISTNTIFNGVLDLKIKSLNETSQIKLHANELQFLVVQLMTENGTRISLRNERIDPVTDILTLTINETGTTLQPNGTYIIHFEYTGQLRTDSMYGFYRSQYTKNGVNMYLATTQFESTHARRAFPCFDEPSFKAKFLISIKHSSALTALSNTPVVNTTTVNNVTTTTFEETPRMSTYLIAFVVSDFTCQKSSTSLLNISHRVCSREEFSSIRSLALDVGPKLLSQLEKFSNITFNFSGINKIDQVAIPDFSAGAMENWGIVTYRESALLWDSLESSNRYKQRVVTVIAHELAHMWFGDLVTLHWWSDTFLNEGFARYFQYVITAEVETDWEMDKQFVLEEMQPVLQSDGLQSSEPLSFPVITPSEVSSRFGSISYNKGGSVIRMVAHFLGDANFKKGINKYLTDNAFGNVNPEKLWSALQAFAPENLPEQLTIIMQNWTIQAGYPLVNVENVGNNIFISQQTRFLTDSGIANENDKWYIPISYTTSRDSHKFENTLPKKWLQPSDTNLILENILLDENDWIVLNNQQTSYYRINYSNDLLNRISKALSQPAFSGIHVLNRAQLVDDFSNFAKAGLRTYSEFLNFISFLKKDTSYFPWYSAIRALSSLLQRTGNKQLREQLSGYIMDLMQVFYNQVPFDDNKDDDQIYTHKKVLALTWACNIGVTDCIKNTLASFSNYVAKRVKPNKNLRSVVYCNGLRHSSNITAHWNFLWNEYTATDLATEQVTILTALGCATNKTLLTNYLNMSINASSGIRQQDALSVFAAVYSGNPDGVDVAAEFLYANHETIANYYGSMNSKKTLMSALADRFNNEKQVQKLEKFTQTTGLDEELKSAALTALDISKANLNVTKKLEAELKRYFAHSSASSSKIGVTIVFVVVPIFYKLINVL